MPISRPKIIVANKEVNFDESGWVKEKIASGSITPSSYISREFEASFADRIFIDSYLSKNGVEIQRFGINITAPDVIEEAKKTKVDLIDSSGSGGSGKGSFKSQTAALNYMLTSQSDSIIHLEAEVEAFQQAINHLFADNNRVIALVDIVVRTVTDDKSSLVFPDTLKTHTVVLYKNPSVEGRKHSVVVIDPNNFTFSFHLSNKDLTDKISHDQLEKIIAFKTGKKIYDPEKNSTGFATDKFRDCIDIAVKLGFYLSSPDIFCPEAARVSAGAGSALPTAAEIANEKDLLSMPAILALERGELQKLWYSDSDFAIRARQSSDPSVSYKFWQLGNKIDKKLNIVAILNKYLYTIKVDKSDVILNYAYDEKVISELSRFNKELLEIIIPFVDETPEKLVELGESTYIKTDYDGGIK